jgi:hypothetical protein
MGKLINYLLQKVYNYSWNKCLTWYIIIQWVLETCSHTKCAYNIVRIRCIIYKGSGTIKQHTNSNVTLSHSMTYNRIMTHDTWLRIMSVNNFDRTVKLLTMVSLSILKHLELLYKLIGVWMYSGSPCWFFFPILVRNISLALSKTIKCILGMF